MTDITETQKEVMLRLLQSVEEDWGKTFDADGDEGDMNGGDVVEWLCEFIQKVRADVPEVKLDPDIPQFTTYNFKCRATETLHGTAYFSVNAASEEEARLKLADDAGYHFDDFSESDSGTEWDAKAPEDWELM